MPDTDFPLLVFEAELSFTGSAARRDQVESQMRDIVAALARIITIRNVIRSGRSINIAGRNVTGTEKHMCLPMWRPLHRLDCLVRPKSITHAVFVS